MADTKSIFPGLPLAPQPPTPKPGFQIEIKALADELAKMGNALQNASADDFEAIMSSIAPVLGQLMEVSGMAIAERVEAIAQAYPGVAEVISAVCVRIEIQRFVTLFSVDAVALCPAAAEAREAAEAEDEADDDDNT